MQVRENMRQRLRQTTDFKDGVERPARTDNQQNVGDRAKAVLRMDQHCAHAHVLADPQQVVGDKHGDKHRGDGVADKLQQGIQRAFFAMFSSAMVFTSIRAIGSSTVNSVAPSDGRVCSSRTFRSENSAGTGL